MLSVKVSSNIKQFEKQMSRFAKKQLPYVASRTINTCAKHVRKDAINNTFRQGFKSGNASRFAKGVLRMKFSNKRDFPRGKLQSSVLDHTGKDYLLKHQHGGVRTPKTGQFIAVPSRDTKRKLGFRRNIKFRPKHLTNEKGVFVMPNKKGGRSKFVMMQGVGDKRKLLYSFVPSVPNPKRLNFYERGGVLVKRIITSVFTSEFNKAKRTIKF